MAEGAKVTRIDAITVISDEGIPTTGKRVWFKVEKTGTVDRVDIADADYSQENVNVLIDQRVKVAEQLFDA